MKNLLKLLLITGVIVSIQLAGAVPTENEYGNVKAWFNGQEATVEGVKLKIGEPVDIKVTVNSNISGHVFVKLKNPLVTVPYLVIEGVDIDKRIDNLGISPGWSKTFSWKVKPNGAWTNGNAPINILVKFYNIQSEDDKIIEFTIADPYILNEQYSGVVSVPVQTPQTTEPATGTSPPPKSTPFIPAILAIAILMLAVWLWRRRK